MKIFLDTNILLDLVQDRAGAPDARKIVDIGKDNSWVRIYVSYLSMAKIAYVLRKRPTEEVKDCLTRLYKLVDILPMNDMQLITAIRSCDSPDFEDALQIMCAEEKMCDVILTGNTAHFRNYTDIPVLSPAEFLSQCNQKSK